MPDYKRKHRSRFKAAPKVNKKRVRKEEYSNDIEMTPHGEKPQKQKMRVVKGRKLEQKRNFKIFASAIGVLLIVFIICQLIIPAGIVETVSNSFAVMGAGKYPLELNSSDTLNVVSKGSYYYVLSDTEICAVSNSGKLIFSHTHGFEKPVLKTSSTRALVFDQGGTGALIFNLSGLKTTIKNEKEIINANIGENGSYALITPADNYVSSVSVYKKNNKLVYEWLSSNDMINSVALAPNGKKIAISTMSSNVGSYDSKVSILNFKSANSEYTKDFKNTIIYELDSASNSGFAVVTENSCDFISWRGKNITEYKNDYNSDMYRSFSSGKVMVLNRESDKTDNRIVVFSKNGKLKSQIQFKGVITDIAVKGNNIYCLSDTNVYILDIKGQVLRTAQGGFGAQRFAVIGQNKVAVITDNLITELKIKQE